MSDYVKSRYGKWRTASLLIEKETLEKLPGKTSFGLSMQMNWLAYRWLKENYPKEKKIRELADSVFRHRIAVGWAGDRRRRMKNAVRKSVTLDDKTREMLKTLRDKFRDIKECGIEDGYWVRDSDGFAFSCVWPCGVMADSASQSEILNGILRLALDMKEMIIDHEAYFGAR
jgi:hypothetical protein